MTTYLLAGGGTAGHVNPLLAVADRLRERDPEAVILALGTAEGLEARLVPARGHRLLTIPKLPFPRRPNAAMLRFPTAFAASVRQVRTLLREHEVDVVVGFGGYACPPAYLAARLERVPIVVHEANSKPGMANVLGSWLTSHVGVTFRGTRLPHSTLTGMPLRPEIEQLDVAAARTLAHTEFGLDPDLPTLLVTGGSTGARSINAAIAASVPLLLGAGWQVLHITGERDTVDDPGLHGYHLLRYCDRMDLALAAAGLAVSRAGAATVTELAAVGVPAILVPYPVGNGEQRFNARDLVEAGGARLVLDRDFTPEWIARELIPLLRRPDAVADMAARSGRVGMRDGTDRLVVLIDRALSAGTKHRSVG